MRRAASEGFINATDCADYLVKKGLPFRDAYTILGKLVRRCMETGKTLETLPLDEYKSFSPLFDDDVYEAVKLETCVELRNVPGGPSSTSVAAQLDSVRAFLRERLQ
jgi:argininosuccinate lyase